MKKINMTVTALLVISGVLHAKTTLTVYSSMENEQLAEYKKSFENNHPDIELKFIRDSTGIITARLLAEKDNPQADVV